MALLSSYTRPTLLRLCFSCLVPLFLCLYVLLPVHDAWSRHPEPLTSTSNWPRWRSLIEESSLFREREDPCSAALPGSISSQCTPSNTSVTTLCCVRPDSVYPQCSVILGVGFCVVSAAGDSYTDTESVCEDAKSVSCPTTDGSKACCPEFTTCPSGNLTSNSVLRCGANSSSLSSLFATKTSTTSKATSTPQTTTTASTAATTTPASSTSVPAAPGVTNPPVVTSTSSISGGAIAGIVIGILILVVAAGLTGWFIARKRRNAHAAGAMEIPQHDGSPPAQAGEYRDYEMYGPTTYKSELEQPEPSKYALGQQHQNPQELYVPPSELYDGADTRPPPQELEASHSFDEGSRRQ